MMKNILITGASGFIGSFLVEEAVKRGWNTWAGLRAGSSRKYLGDERIRFLVLDMSRPDTMRVQLADHKVKYGKFDYIVHCAGATKCQNKAMFEQVNYRQTKDFIEALRELEMIPELFVFVSTLGVFGPIHEHDSEPIRENDPMHPNTAYGKSKWKAEQYLMGLKDFPYVIFRPTGVYGPRETDYFLMAKSIRNHFDFMVGYTRQDLTFVYVKDVVQAIFLAIDRKKTGRAYALSDGKVYQSTTFSSLIAAELGIRYLLRLRVPVWVLWVVSQLAGRWAIWSGKPSTLNPDKYRIMKQRNWRCDINPAVEELGYRPEYDLRKGVKETIAWYKQEKWL